MFDGLLRFENLEHLWIKTHDLSLGFNDHNVTLPVKHLHLFGTWHLYPRSFPVIESVFTQLETFHVDYFFTDVYNLTFNEILQNQLTVPLRAISFHLSQLSVSSSILDLSMLSSIQRETCEYLDFSRNRFFAVAYGECISINCPKLKLLDLSYNQLFKQFSIDYGYIAYSLALDDFALFTASIKELQILNLSNQINTDKTVPYLRKSCRKLRLLNREQNVTISAIANRTDMTQHGLRRLNLDFFGSDRSSLLEINKKDHTNNSDLENILINGFYIGAIGLNAKQF